MYSNESFIFGLSLLGYETIFICQRFNCQEEARPPLLFFKLQQQQENTKQRNLVFSHQVIQRNQHV